jgi:nitrogen fixation/metabolism regulation signal transduction histidine kinase
MRELFHERRVLLLTLIAALPVSVIALILLWTEPYSTRNSVTLTILIAIVWLGFAASTRQRVAFPLQTLSNLLAAMREGDYSIRGRGADSPDALGDVIREVNALGQTLREQRLGAVEATTLLRKVVEEIDFLVFTLDVTEQLLVLNRAVELLLSLPAGRILRRTA